jgi:hypothetical protein
MNKVLRITLHGELQVLTDPDLAACIREANRLNAERGYTNGVHVVELEDGQRMTAAGLGDRAIQKQRRTTLACWGSEI